VGGVGTPVGTAGKLGAEGADVPWLFAAVTVNVYAVPLRRSVIVQVRELREVQVCPPGVAVTLYSRMGLPPVC
jgi:hypothetical protein